MKRFALTFAALALGKENVTLIAAEPGKRAGAEGNPPASRFTFAYSR